MKKPILKGPKLIAVGPLKCFKGGGSGGGGGGGSCFIAGTLVTMADGSKRPIEKVLLGEKVKGLDDTINTVMEYNRPPLAYSALGEVRKLYSINGGIAFFTDEHPFYTTTGWKSLNPKATYAELKLYTLPGQEMYPELLETTVMKVGDEIVTEDGTVKIETIEEHDADFYTQLYNFILDGDHTYLANGYVVHNGGGGGKGGGGGGGSSKGGGSSSGSPKLNIPKLNIPKPKPKKEPETTTGGGLDPSASGDDDSGGAGTMGGGASGGGAGTMGGGASGGGEGTIGGGDGAGGEGDEEKSEGYSGPSLGLGGDKTGSDEPGGTPKKSSGEGEGFGGATSSDIQNEENRKRAAAKKKAAEDLAARDKLAKEQSPFSKQLSGVDTEKAVEAEKDRKDDRGFLSKAGTFLEGLTTGQFTTDQGKVDTAQKSYDDARKSQGIAEARRLGRPIVIDGKSYDPNQQTPEEESIEQQSAADLGIGVDQFREEMSAEAEAGPEAKGLRETASLEEALTERQVQEAPTARARVEAQQAEQARQRAAGSQMMQEWEGDVRSKQAEMDLARGNIKPDEYEAVTGKPAPPQLVEKGLRAAKGLARGMVERAVTPGGVPDVEGAAEKAKSYDLADTAVDAGLAAAGPLGWAAKGLGLDKYAKKAVKTVTDPVTGALKTITDPVVDAVSGAISPITKPITDTIKKGQDVVMGKTDEILGTQEGPVSFQDAITARAEEADPNKPVRVEKRGSGGGGGAGVLAPLAGVAATALAPKPKPMEVPEVPDVKPGGGKVDIQGERADLVDSLKKQASGEESLAEKQVRQTQDRSLAQRLAAMKSMRGQDSGSKLRSFSKASDKARREAEGQIEMAGMKERRSAQDQLRAQLDTMSQEEATERWRKISRDDKQRLLKMNRDDAIAKGEYQKWLTVTAMGQKFFKDEIKDAGDWVGTNVLDPIKEGGKKLLKKGGDFIKDAFGFDEGGFVSGPGTETSDSIPARLSDGEFVVKSSAVRGLGKVMGGKGKKGQRKKGVDFLYKLQDKMDKVEKFSQGGEFVDPDSFVRSFNEEIEKEIKKTKKFKEGGEAYVRPKKAFREAIGYEGESRFHDKAAKDAKHGGARRKFRHFQQGGPVSLDVKGMKPQFNPPQSQGFGSVVAAQKDLQRRLEELERQLGR